MPESIIIPKEAMKILNSTMPEWMKTLTKVNYDADQLDEIVRKRLNFYTSCLIGELHDKDTDYNECSQCWDLAKLCPHVLDKKADDDKLSDLVLPIQDENWNISHIDTSSKGIAKFFKYLAYHIEQRHPEILKHKTKMAMCQDSKQCLETASKKI